MNGRLIVFSAVLTAIVGSVVGVAAAEIAQPKFQSEMYRNLHPKYAVVGSIVGLVVGGSQEAIRQLKKQRDQEDSLQDHQRR